MISIDTHSDVTVVGAAGDQGLSGRHSTDLCVPYDRQGVAVNHQQWYVHGVLSHAVRALSDECEW